MFNFKKLSARDFAGTSAAPPRRARPKRNRAAERLRRNIQNFRSMLYQRAAALHEAADDLKQDDPEARCNEDVPTTCVQRIRARQIEAIADIIFAALFKK